MRDLRRAWSSGTIWLPVAFFLLIATFFPFAVGPDAALLAETGGGIVWIAALLAALLPIDRLIRSDHEAGVFDQLAVRGISDEVIAAMRIMSHALSFGVPLLAALLPVAALLNLSAEKLASLAVGLAIACPAIASLAVMSAALTASLRGGSLIASLLVLPLAVPLLIFGAGMLDTPTRGATGLLTAASLLLTAAGPFAAGAALRALRDQ